MKVRMLRPAVEDLLAGHRFYDLRLSGLGTKFCKSLFAEIDSLGRRAGFHRRVFEYHRLLSKRFPYAIYYRIDGFEVVIRRIIDCRCDPSWVRAALRKRLES